jgi:zinc protease
MAKGERIVTPGILPGVPKRWIAVAGLILILAVSARPQSPPIPNAEQIITRYIGAIGGRAAWEVLHSRTSLGSIEFPSMHLSGTVMIHEKAPNRVLQVVILEGAIFRQGFDGKLAWSDDPQDGVKIKSGEELSEAARDADFYRPININKMYSKIAVTGQDEVEGRKAYLVEATEPDGGVEKIYFDTQSGLIVRVIAQRHVGEAVTTFQQDSQDYSEVDGVKLPFTVIQTGGGVPFTIHFGEFHHNVDLEDSEFAKPDVQ